MNILNEAPWIMLVEDETEIRELMVLHLSRNGYNVAAFSSVESAYQKLNEKNFILFILDWMLPGQDGPQLIPSIKKTHPFATILMVTAKTQPDDVVSGLEKGADDFISKPFDTKIFIARVKALIRRSTTVQTHQDEENPKDIEHLGLNINLDHYKVLLNGEELHLTPSEFKLLVTLMKNKGKVLNREVLIEQIQGEGVNVTGRTIDTHIFGLRKKLSTWSDNVESIRGVGYRVRI